MSNKVKVFSSTFHRKESGEEGVEVELEGLNDPIHRSPNHKTSIKENFEKSEFMSFRTNGRMNTLHGSPVMIEDHEDYDEQEVQFLFKELGGQKKSHLLKNFTFEGLRDVDIREDYFVLLCFITVYGGDELHLDEFKGKSQVLNSLNYLHEKPKQILRRKEFISKVLIAAAHQNEDLTIKEIIKNDSLGYIVSIQVVLAFLRANQHQFLKSLLKVVEPNKMGLYQLSTLTSLVPESLSNKTALTYNNMPKRGKPLQGMDALDSSPALKGRGGTRLEHGMTMREIAGTAVQMNNMRRGTIIDRELLPKSAYDNVIIEARFDTVFPHLIQMNRMDLVEPLLEYFGEKHINHLNLFIGFSQEELAMSHYKKFGWELTEGQIIMLFERRMWRFLCNITDDTQKMLFFSDQTFTAIAETLQDGKILSEMILVFMTLPIRGWRQNQILVLMELAKNILDEDPVSSKLIYANNPILTCAQLSYLLKQIQNSGRFRFFQNELEVLSERLVKVAENLQNETRENNLYALYLQQLPTGLTMLDYIVRMEIKGLVETKFTKALVFEFWNDILSVNGNKTQISFIAYGAKAAKRFSWKIAMKPALDHNFAFQFGNVMNSPKFLLFMDLFYILIFYVILDWYTYDKVGFFESAKDPVFYDTLPDYFLDVGYAKKGYLTVVQVILMINFWIFLLYRCLHVSTLHIGKTSYKVGYYCTFLALSLSLLTLVIFPSYDSQIKHHVMITSCLVVTRCCATFIFLVSLLGFQKSGELVTILSTVVVSLVPILLLLNVYMLFYSEIMHNFFYDYQLFNTAVEAYLSLVEVLFGSLTFADVEKTPDGVSEYYTLNLNLTYFAFSSNILATFLIIAYLSSILEAVRQDASYQNTLSQYYFLQMFSSTEFKGFYTFPAFLSVFTLPLTFVYRIPKLKAKVNLFLLKIRFYLVWVPFQIIKSVIQSIFYYCPLLYFRNMVLISSNKMAFKGSLFLNLVGWIFLGPFVMIYYILVDIRLRVHVMNLNFEVSMPQNKILLRSTDDNVIYIHRYGSLKEAVLEFTRKFPEQEGIPYMAILEYLMSGGKEVKVERTISLRKTRKAREILAELVKEHLRRTSGSKWLKNIHAAKKKLFKEILDGFLNYKAMNMRPEDATIDPKLVLDLLVTIDDETVNYLRGKHVSTIQMVLLNAQSKEQISIMNKIEDLDKKVELLSKMWSSHLPKMVKLPSILTPAPSGLGTSGPSFKAL